jgi:hypothetical protein
VALKGALENELFRHIEGLSGRCSIDVEVEVEVVENIVWAKFVGEKLKRSALLTIGASSTLNRSSREPSNSEYRLISYDIKAIY